MQARVAKHTAVANKFKNDFLLAVPPLYVLVAMRASARASVSQRARINLKPASSRATEEHDSGVSSLLLDSWILP